MEYNVLFALFRGNKEAKTERFRTPVPFIFIIMIGKGAPRRCFCLLKALYRKIPQL